MRIPPPPPPRDRLALALAVARFLGGGGGAFAFALDIDVLLRTNFLSVFYLLKNPPSPNFFATSIARLCLVHRPAMRGHPQGRSWTR